MKSKLPTPPLQSGLVKFEVVTALVTLVGAANDSDHEKMRKRDELSICPQYIVSILFVP
jgi:hypothetical protein